MKKVIVFIALTFYISNLFAQEDANKPSKDTDFRSEYFAIHPKIGLGINSQLANFSQFDGMVSCGDYHSIISTGFSSGIYLERLVFRNTFLSLGCGYHTNKCDGFGIEKSEKMRNPKYNTVTKVKTNIGLETDMALFEIQPDLRYILSPTALGGGPLRFIIGARVIMPKNASYKQWEEIKSPSYVTFESDGTQYRELVSGNISTMNDIVYGLTFGIDNLIRLGKGHAISQELLFNYNFSNWTTDADWGLFAVRLSLGYRIGLNKKEKNKEPAEVSNETVYMPVEEAAIMDINDMPELEKSIPPELHISYTDISEIEKTSGTELLATVPLVNAVFFEKNSAIISPEYYGNDVPNPNFFTVESVEAHKYLIPRIAEIIAKNVDSKIVLIGATSGKDETGGLELAQNRSEAVKKAFIDAGVPEGKISIKARKTPEIPSNDEFENGIIENRRVDIQLVNAQYQEYVDFLNFSEIKGKIMLRVDAKGMMPSQIIRVVSSIYDKPFTFSLDELNTNNEIPMPFKTKLYNQEEAIDVNITGEALGQDLTFVVSGTINNPEIINQMIDKDLSNFRAILRFDYNKSVLTNDNRELLKQLGEILPEGATISILGSADDLGSGARNAQLTRERAEVTRKFINKNFKGKFKIVTGQSNQKVKEDTPQGRFINRCIIITVKK